MTSFQPTFSFPMFKPKKIIIPVTVAIVAAVAGIAVFIGNSRLFFQSDDALPAPVIQTETSSPDSSAMMKKQEIIRQQEAAVLSKFVASEEGAAVAPDDYIIYRQGNALYRYGLRHQRTTHIISLPPIDESQIPESPFEDVFARRIITAGSDIYIDGKLYGLSGKTIGIGLNGEASIASNPCVIVFNLGPSSQTACSPDHTRRVELEDVSSYVGNETSPTRSAFKVRSYASDGTLFLENTITDSEILRLNNVVPLLITNNGKEVFIAAVGDEGGYWGLWQFNMETSELVTYKFGDFTGVDNGAFLETGSRYYSGYLFSPTTNQMLLDSQRSRYGASECLKLNSTAQIYLVDLTKDKKRLIERDQDFIYGISISPDERWYTFSRADVPPECRETIRAGRNTQHWLVPLPSNRTDPRAKLMPGSFIAWLNANLVLLRKETGIAIYDVNSTNEQILSISDPKLFEVIGTVSVQ